MTERRLSRTSGGINPAWIFFRIPLALRRPGRNLSDVIAPDPSTVPQAAEAASPSFFIHFAQPAVLCVLGIAIILAGIELVRWLFRNVLSDSESRAGRSQLRLNAVSRKRRRKQR
jgi:hypothetical protein